MSVPVGMWHKAVKNFGIRLKVLVKNLWSYLLKSFYTEKVDVLVDFGHIFSFFYVVSAPVLNLTPSDDPDRWEVLLWV